MALSLFQLMPPQLQVINMIKWWKIFFFPGKPYGTEWRAEWKYLYTLAKDHPNTGSFSFEPKPGQDGWSSWELGSVRVSSNVHQEGKRW